MKLNLELIDRLFGKSGRSIQRMLESDQLTAGFQSVCCIFDGGDRGDLGQAVDG